MIESGVDVSDIELVYLVTAHINCRVSRTTYHVQWRSQGGGGGGRGGGGGASAPPPQSQKKHYLKKAKSVEKLGGGGGTRYILEAETD